MLKDKGAASDGKEARVTSSKGATAGTWLRRIESLRPERERSKNLGKADLELEMEGQLIACASVFK